MAKIHHEYELTEADDENLLSIVRYKMNSLSIMRTIAYMAEATWGWISRNANYFTAVSAVILVITWIINIILVDRLKGQQERLAGIVRLQDDANTRDLMLLGQSNAEKQLTRIENRQNELIESYLSKEIREAGTDSESSKNPKDIGLQEGQWKEIVWALEGVTWAQHYRADVGRTSRYATVIDGMLKMISMPDRAESSIRTTVADAYYRDQKMHSERFRHEARVTELLGRYSISRNGVTSEKFDELMAELRKHSEESKKLLEGHMENQNVLMKAGSEIVARAKLLQDRSKRWETVWFVTAACLTLIASILSVAAKFQEARKKAVEIRNENPKQQT